MFNVDGVCNLSTFSLTLRMDFYSCNYRDPCVQG